MAWFVVEYIVIVMSFFIEYVYMSGTYCEFYFYDQDQFSIRAYYMYCSDGCCTNDCCYNYYPDDGATVGVIVGIVIGSLVGLGICIAFCACVFKVCCSAPAPQSGQVVSQRSVAYIQSQGQSEGQVNLAYAYSPRNQGFGATSSNEFSALPPSYDDVVKSSAPPYTGILNNASANINNTIEFTPSSTQDCTSSSQVTATGGSDFSQPSVTATSGAD